MAASRSLNSLAVRWLTKGPNRTEKELTVNMSKWTKWLIGSAGALFLAAVGLGLGTGTAGAGGAPAAGRRGSHPATGGRRRPDGGAGRAGQRRRGPAKLSGPA